MKSQKDATAVNRIKSFMESAPNEAPNPQIELSPEQQEVLANWARADEVLNNRPWTEQEQQECAEALAKYPTLQPTSIDLVKFGGVDGLLRRYKAVLSQLVEAGMIGQGDADKSAAMAVSGGISIAQVIAEGKVLKAWLDGEKESREVSEAFDQWRERRERKAPDETTNRYGQQDQAAA